MNEENNVPLVVSKELESELNERIQMIVLGENICDNQIICVVDHGTPEIELLGALPIVVEEFDLPTKMMIELKRFCEEEKETYLREIEGSFKVQKRQKFKSPSWNF